MSKPIVIALGEILWDMLPTGKRAGGAPVNFAYHASQNGAESYAISAVGNDELGAELLNDAHKAGINTLVQTNEYPTGTVAVALTNGIPEYTIVQNVAWDHIGYTDELAEAVSKADAICFGTLGLRSQESHDTIIKLLQHAKEGALKFFDINLRANFYSKELIEELLARIRVALRRVRYDSQKTSAEAALYENGDLKIDYAGGRACCRGAEMKLTPMEYKLLCLLAKNTGKVLTHNYIISEIWGVSAGEAVAEIPSLRVFMATLRKKLELDPSHPQYIQTHVGVGYRMIRQRQEDES